MIGCLRGQPTDYLAEDSLALSPDVDHVVPCRGIRAPIGQTIVNPDGGSITSSIEDFSIEGS